MSYIPEALRRSVIERANGYCEYCRVHQQDSLYPHEIDHIIPEKHRGQTTEDNLCLSCIEFNRHKGSDFASFDPLTGEIVQLYHPRRDRWTEHFRLEGARIIALTPTGRVTEYVLTLNNIHRVWARADLISVERYPPKTIE